MRRERRAEARCVNEVEEHRGADQEGTRQTDKGRQRADHRKNVKALGMRNPNMTQHKKHKAKSEIMTHIFQK